MSTTLKILSFPANSSGISVTASASSWVAGQWVTLCQRTNKDIYLSGLTFQYTYVGSDDTTYQVVFELGLGQAGDEITNVQIPYSNRRDTNVAYYLDNVTNIFFPEAMFIPRDTRIAVRVANSVASAVTYEGVKLLYQSDVAIPENNIMPNNYKFMRAENGISVGEKMR